MNGIAHPARHLLHDVGKSLVKIDGLIDDAILRVDLLLLRNQLLLYRGRAKLIGVLLRMNLEQRSGIDHAE